MARITVAAPVTISPPAQTLSLTVFPVSSSAITVPRLVVSSPFVVLLGAPGAGKSTHAKKIGAKHDVPVVSAAEVLEDDKLRAEYLAI